MKLLSSIIFGVSLSTCAYAEGKLIFAIDIVRHGDRTPVVESPEMQKIWPQGTGQLTPKGMREEYELGKKLREHYVNQTHLLPVRYDSNSMNVRSSDLPRTLMSAQSLLLGLYPLKTGPSLGNTTFALPEGFQPIPIHTVPRTQDSLLIPGYDKEKYKQLLESYIFNDPEWIQKDAQLKPYYTHWSKIADISINNLFELLNFSDRLFIERLYGVSLPQGLSVEEADLILNSAKWALLHIGNHPAWAAAAGNELAKTIAHEMRLATEQTRPLKYLLFVAHDTTVGAQLGLLGQQLSDLPPYAAQLHYELLDMGASNYEVRVTYLQEPLWIKACGGYRCSLNDFTHALGM